MFIGHFRIFHCQPRLITRFRWKKKGEPSTKTWSWQPPWQPFILPPKYLQCCRAGRGRIHTYKFGIKAVPVVSSSTRFLQCSASLSFWIAKWLVLEKAEHLPKSIEKGHLPKSTIYAWRLKQINWEKIHQQPVFNVLNPSGCDTLW